MKTEKYLSLKAANLPNTKKILSKDIVEKTGRNYIIKMNYNENKFGCSPNIKKAIKINSPNIYPEYVDNSLYDSFSKLTGFSKENFFFSNGSDAILDHIPKIWGPLKENANIVIPSLTYNRIEITCTIFDYKLKKVPLKNFKIDLDEMFNAIDENTTIVYVVNPNMPTGSFNCHKSIMLFLERVSKLKNKPLVVIDEAYIEFAVGIEESYKQDKEIIEKFENVIITRTFSKLFGLASFRVGYCFSTSKNIEIFKKTHQYFPVSKYSLQAVEAALSDIDFYNEILSKTKSEINRLTSELRNMGFNALESKGNFIFVDLKDSNFDSSDLFDFVLHDEGILIREVGKDAIRITTGTEFENNLLLNSLKKFIGKNK